MTSEEAYEGISPFENWQKNLDLFGIGNKPAAPWRRTIATKLNRPYSATFDQIKKDVALWSNQT